MGDHFTPRGRDAATTNRPLGRRARRGALVLAAAGLAAFAPGAANAAPVDYAFSDQSDVASSPAYDLTKGTITIDAETGSMRTHLEFLADFDPTSPTVADVSTGAFDRSGKCVVETSPLTVLAGAVSPKLPTRDWYYADARWGGRQSDEPLGVCVVRRHEEDDRDHHQQRAGARRPHAGVPRRAHVQRRSLARVLERGRPRADESLDQLLDTAQANLVNPVTDPVAPAPTPAPVVVPVVVADSDGDGVPDASDSCRNEPGPAPTGCPAKKGPATTTPVVAVMRLGARKIALDRTIPKAALNATCPAKAKVVVTQNRKRLGAVKLATVDAGANGCRLKGAVKIKRYKKKKSLVVTMSAPGLTTTKQKLKT
ncbi:MAG: hypothetical protein PGN13_04575 [Patulibacter minatonensis]